MGVDYDYAHAASLCVCLPPEGALGRAMNPDNAYDLHALLLRAIDHDLRVLAWQKTENGAKGIDYPEPLPLPSESGENKDIQININRAFVDSVLGR